MRPTLPLALTALAVLAVLALAPSASAHATYDTDDGQYLITIGNQGEPVHTFQVTGLDLIIRENTTERPEVAGVDGTLNATIIAPGGEELDCPLEVQHGATGRYTCGTAYVYTQPGLYQVRLTGDIMGSPATGTYDMAHAIPSQSDIMFPNQDLATPGELQQRIATLEARLAQLESERTTQSDNTDDANAEAPAAGLLTGLLAVALVAIVARRR